MKSIFPLFLIGLLVLFSDAKSQTNLSSVKAIILSVEDDKVYIDLGEGSISAGDRLQVLRDRGFFTHPVSGEQIPREPEIVGHIQIIDVRSNYSEGTVSPRGAISALETGMAAFLLEGTERDAREFRKSIAVQPLNVSSALGGYLGIYIADLLTEEIFNVDQFRVIDRQSLGWQIDEIALATLGVIDENEAIRVGRTRGIDYFITGTMYEPDVVDISTGVPIKGIVGAAEALSGKRLGSEFASDVRVSQLRAIVNITLRVVNVETGEIIFMATEMQQATGRSQVNLEQGALGGLQLQGGATSFLNTITGQATKAALTNLAGYINGYFDGSIDVRNFRGNIIDVGRVGTKSKSNKGRGKIIPANVISSEFVGVIKPKFGNPLIQEFEAIIDKGSNDGYRRYNYYYLHERSLAESNITGKLRQSGYTRIGNIKLTVVEDQMAKGIITIYNNYKPEDYSFNDVIISWSKKAPK